MGQSNSRHSLVSEEELASEQNNTINSSNVVLAASCPLYYAKPPCTTPRSTLLHPLNPDAHSPNQSCDNVNASAPDLHTIHKFHLFKHSHSLSRSLPLNARQANRMSPHQTPAERVVRHERTPSELATVLLCTPRGNDLSVSINSNYVSNSNNIPAVAEAQRRAMTQCREKMMTRAAEEAATMHKGELEVLASGFLSLADYVYVAEAVKGLSSVLLCEDERAMRCINAAKGRDNADRFNASSSTPLASLENCSNKANAIGALTPTSAVNIVTSLPWTVMRDALLSRRAVQNAPVNGISTATLQQPVAHDQSQLPDVQINTHCTSLNVGCLPDSTSADRHGDSPRSESSTPTASLGNSGLKTPGAVAVIPDHGRTAREIGVTPLNATLADSPMLSKISVSGELTRTADPQQRLAATPRAAFCPSAYAISEAATERPLSLADLIVITAQDDVLDVFLQSMAKKIRGFSKKLQALPPFIAFRYCIGVLVRAMEVRYATGSPISNQKMKVHKGVGLLSAKALQGTNSTQNLAVGTSAVKSSEGEWICAETVVERILDDEEMRTKQERDDALAIMGDDARRLFQDTKDILLKSLAVFASALPLGVNSRINNNYLLPTEAVLASYIGCGVYKRRQKEFFVSMADRVKMLEGHHSFQSTESMLLGISQLSNLASQMLSSFAIGAVLAFTQRWRELYEAGTTKTDDIIDILEAYAVEYCKAFDIMCNEAFPTLRRQYPNVFVVSSFIIKEEEGGRPPMITVAVSTVLKLLFLFAGGLESIRADDRRLLADVLKEEQKRTEADRRESTVLPSSCTTQLPSAPQRTSCANNSHGREPSETFPHSSREAPVQPDCRRTTISGEGMLNLTRSQASVLDRVTSHNHVAADVKTAMTDDVALASALHVSSASTLVLLGDMLSGDPLSAQVQTTHEAARLAHAVSGFWRVLFQTAGLLPYGTACPREMSKWLPLFPLYAVNLEAKRALLQVYAKTMSINPLFIGPIQRADVLQSTANIVTEIVRASGEARSAANSAGRPSLSISGRGFGSPSTLMNTPPAAGLSQPSMALGDIHHNSSDEGNASHAPADVPREGHSLTQSTFHNPATVSHRIIPIFMVNARKAGGPVPHMLYGLRSGSKFDHAHLNPTAASELRQDLFDLTARFVTEPFLPSINLGKETRLIPVPGGTAAVHTDRLSDCNAETLKKLQELKDKLVVVVTWKKSAVTAHQGERATRVSIMSNGPHGNPCDGDLASNFVCPIRVGDEVTIRWSSPVSGNAAADASQTRAKPRANEGSGAASERPASALPLSPSQRHTVALVLRTTSSFQYLVVLDAPNFLINYHVPHADSTTATAATFVVSARRRSSVCTASNKSLGLQRRSFMSLQSVNLAHLEDAAAGAPAIADMLLHRRQTSPLTRSSDKICAWVNPQYVADSATAAAAQWLTEVTKLLSEPSQHRSSPAVAAAVTAYPELAVPMLLGWLLGQSAGNDVTFTLPLPPLAFRILSQALDLDESLDEVQLDAADISLQSPDCTREELCQRVLDEMRKLSQSPTPTNASFADDVHFSGSPAVTRRQYRHLKSQLKDALAGMSWNGSAGSGTTVRDFWAAMLQGLRHTPLVETPVFAQCCARTLHDVLCGPYDHLAADFSFRKSFLLLTNVGAPLNGYRVYVRKCVKCVLDEDFSVSEKRLLLRFITGHTLRVKMPFMEMIGIYVQHQFATRSDATGGNRRNSMQLAKPQKSDRSNNGDDALHHNGKKTTEEDNAEVCVTERVTRSAIDRTLQLLPVSRSSDSTLIIPNYFDALLMGSYRENVLGASVPWFKQHSGIGEAAASTTSTVACDEVGHPTEEEVVLDEDDFQSAWSSLSAAQQEALKRRFRELLVHRLRAALYAFLVGQDDAIEASWDLADKLGLGVSPTLLNEAGCSEASGTNANGTATNESPRIGGAFMRCHDGTIVFIDHNSVGVTDLAEFEELPFGDDDLMDDTESLTGTMADGELRLDNSAFGFFDEADAEAPTAMKAFRMSLRNSSISDELEADTAEHSEHEDEVYSVVDLNGYHTAASFCFGDDEDLPPPGLVAPADSDDDFLQEKIVKQIEKADVLKAAETEVTIEEKSDFCTTAASAAAPILSSNNSVTITATATHSAVRKATRPTGSTNNINNLVPMAVAPSRPAAIANPRVNTLLHHARAPRLDTTTNRPNSTSTSTSTSTSPSTQLPVYNTSSYCANTKTPLLPAAQPPSYSARAPATTTATAATAVAPVCVVAPVKATQVAFASTGNALMDEVDSDIRELFPDEEFLVV